VCSARHRCSVFSLSGIGDPTATNIVIAFATLSLPFAMLWQAIAEGTKRRTYWRLSCGQARMI
jgi:hypothetical protein